MPQSSKSYVGKSFSGVVLFESCAISERSEILGHLQDIWVFPQIRLGTQVTQYFLYSPLLLSNMT